MKLSNATLTGEQVELTDREVNVLGPDLELRDCTVTSMASAKALVIAGLRMFGGSFHQSRPLRNFHFERAHFHGVAFVGRFEGCDFGDWESPPKGSIANCNFSAANLDGCRFLSCEPNTLVLPHWPNFTIIYPAEAHDAVISQQWPAKVGYTMGIYTDVDPECVAVTGDAKRIAEKNGVSLNELEAIFKRVPNIRL